MFFSRLDVQGLRNLQAVKLLPHPALNLLYGDNGAGKSSLLEALSLLANGRSFRTHETKKLIHHEQKETVLFSELFKEDKTRRLGVMRGKSGSSEVRLDGEKPKHQSVITELLPLLVIDPEGFSLIDGGPAERRSFLDRGVFHVEHCFIKSSREYGKVLKQRNQLLRTGNIDPAVLAVWDKQFVIYAEQVEQYRCAYVEVFNKVLTSCLPLLPEGISNIELRYYKGWKEDLATQLKNSITKDCEQGFTRIGPHRADWGIRLEKGLAKDIMSRGQKKQLITLLKICQVLVLKELTAKRVIVLVDDINAELGLEYQEILVKQLIAADTQLFVTGLSGEALRCLFKDQEYKMFHVEHGVVKETGSTV